MFVLATKITKKKIIIALSSAFALIFAVGLLIPKQNADQAMAASQQKNEIIETSSIKNSKIKTEYDVYDYLQSFGWKLNQAPLRIENVIIPDTFDETYLKYNSMQKRQGFDLEKYKGKKVTLYSFCITNHASGEENVIANVLIYKKCVIGGDISSSDVNGFIHGLTENQ